ncbi:MAG: hypothetical protein R3307_11290 [Anaerolineales bacterium]|nr:hypothetical protein [Anaerolineales bacterium]
MKNLIRPAILFTLAIFLALSCALIAFSTRPPDTGNPVGAALFVQTTATSQVEEDRSEVGSTDEIIIMGGVIAAIILIPILLQRKAWMQIK